MADALELASGYSLVSLDQVDSTNEEAKRRAAAGASAGLVIRARRQTAGKGRRGRPWVSPEGNLYLSILLRPNCSPAHASEVSFVAIVALGDALADLLPEGVAPAYKWPNDLLLGGKKAGGILLESLSDGDLTDWLIVGVGVNLVSHPDDTAYPATSLTAAGGRPIGAVALASRFVGEFDRWYENWRRHGFGPVREAWLERAAGVGGQVTVATEDGQLTGVFRDLRDDGALEILDDKGTGHVITAGDVFLPGES